MPFMMTPRGLEEIETAINVISIPLVSVPDRREVETARTNQVKENLMPTLSEIEKRITASFTISEDDFAREKMRQAARRHPDMHGLTPTQLSIARSFGMSPRAFASARARVGGQTAIAAGGRREDEPGLLRAHSEVDRAHKAAYDGAGWRPSAENTSDRELLDAALAALKKYDPNKDDDDNYDRLCTGAVYVMRLLNRVAPAYADIKEK